MPYQAFTIFLNKAESLNSLGLLSSLLYEPFFKITTKK